MHATAHRFLAHPSRGQSTRAPDRQGSWSSINTATTFAVGKVTTLCAYPPGKRKSERGLHRGHVRTFLVITGNAYFRFPRIYTHVAAVALTPLTTHPHTQAELERSPVRGQEQEQLDVSPLPS